jgi:hypothetical protein
LGVGLFWAPPVLWTVLATPALWVLPSPLAGALAAACLHFLGAALGSLGAGPARDRDPSAWAGAGGLMFVSGVLTALPSLGGALARPLAPGWTAALLDLSPVVWVTESSGLDWMRHPSVYELAGAGDIGPDLRLAWSGAWGPGLACASLVVCAWLALRRARARRS